MAMGFYIGDFIMGFTPSPSSQVVITLYLSLCRHCEPIQGVVGAKLPLEGFAGGSAIQIQNSIAIRQKVPGNTRYSRIKDSNLESHTIVSALEGTASKRVACFMGLPQV